MRSPFIEIYGELLRLKIMQIKVTQCFMIGLYETFSYRPLENTLTIIFISEFVDFYCSFILRMPLCFIREGSTTAVNILSIFYYISVHF